MQHATRELLQVLGDEVFHFTKYWSYYGKGPMPTFMVDGFKGKNRVHCDVPGYMDTMNLITVNLFCVQMAVMHGLDPHTPFAELQKKLKISDSDIRPGGRFGSVLEMINEQVFDAASVVAQGQKLAKDGLHEITIGDEQALGMADMRFNLSVHEFMMPAGSVVIHIPREIFKHERFSSLLPELREYLDKSWEIRKQDPTFFKEDGAQVKSRDYAVPRMFADKGGAVSVLVQSHPGPQCALVSKFVLGSAHITMVMNDDSKDSPEKCPEIEQCFEMMNYVHHMADLKSPKIFDDLHRIALSAVLISTVRAGICRPRTMEHSVAKDRLRFLDGLGKKTPLKVEHTAYFILQPEMRTYVDKSVAEDTVATGDSPDKVVLKPIFVHGHFRRQPYGPKRTLRRIQWIKCSIRNRRLLLGDSPAIVTSSTLTQPDDVIIDMAKASRL